MLAYDFDIDMNKSSKWVSVRFMMCGRARPASLTIQSEHTVLTDCLEGIVCLLFLVGLAVFREKASYLVAVHHEVVGGNQGFEHHHPARVGRPLK